MFIPIFSLCFLWFNITELINRKNVNEIIIGEHTYDAKCFFYWLGLVATDGSIAKKDPVISITQCKEQNIPIIIKMMDDVFKDRWKKYEYDRTEYNMIWYDVIWYAVMWYDLM